MNSRERFFNLLKGAPTDRRLFGALLSLYGAKLTGCPLDQFYRDANAYARGQDAVCQLIAPDFLVGPFLLAGFGEAFGSRLHYSCDYVPSFLHPAITSASAISTLKVPDIDHHPRIQFYREAIRLIAAAHGKESVIVGITLNPLDLPIMIMGMDAWLTTILTDEVGTRQMLDMTIPFFIRLCGAFIADGADVIAIPMAFFTRDIATRSMVSEIALPVLREALSKIEKPVIFHHTGSSFIEHIDLLDTLPGVLGYTVDVLDDLPDTRRHICKDAVLFGGFDGPSLHTMTPNAIRKRSLDLLTQLKNDSRWVLFATGTDVDLRTPAECLTAIGQAVEEFGNG